MIGRTKLRALRQISLVLVIIASPSGLGKSDRQVLRIPVPEGVDEITYSPERVSLSALRSWLRLSPVLSQNNYFLVPERAEACDGTDPRYAGCGANYLAHVSSNARYGLERIRKRIHLLESENFPKGLEEVVQYFLKVQSFALWRNQQELSFYETYDVSILRRHYFEVDPSTACADVLARVDAASTKAAAWDLVRFQWDNCMWKQVHDSIGDYPQNVWNAFLVSQGVSERLIVEDPDDPGVR